MSRRTPQIELLLAGAGAIVVMLGLDTVASVAGLVAILLGTVLTAPAGRDPGRGWWGLLATGSVLSVLGAVVSPAADGVGGLLALLGGAAVLVGVVLGYER